MARKKARQRISYVLPLADSPGGHRLGVNSLAVDCDQSILYSAGRDGVICAWDLNLPLRNTLPDQSRTQCIITKTSTTFRSQSEAHTHWVNDILLAQSNTALVSASSDITVKLWRPHAEDGQKPITIGQHDDYVKCLASPGSHSDWVASGGLDRKIRVWDLNGGGEKLQLDAGEDESSAKGSVYALSVRGSLMASGGPESVLRLWDPKSGKRITKFVGHTDNLRAILINEHGDMIMTASSDQTIKIWSLAAGRCMNTLTMHNDSVWSLYSDHPQLSVFYSSDRSGMVAKTDVRGSSSMDEGISVAIAQEHEGVNKVIVGGGYFWTATSNASINRWRDVDTSNEVQEAESPRLNRRFSLVTRSKAQSSLADDITKTMLNGDGSRKIPLSSILKISNSIAPKLRELDASTVYSGASIRKPSEALVVESDLDAVVPFHTLPDETIEGQHGLIKHVILNDRKRVLTLDTAGEVVLWDLLKCVAIQSFGKRHLEDVVPEINTMESVANWCGVDTRTGRLAVALEENYCFDAEVYADETSFTDSIEFRDDQRINLGKWVLRYLFSSLIDEEIKRDEAYRAELQHSREPGSTARVNAPLLGQLPLNSISGWNRGAGNEDCVITPRPTNGYPTTPGLAIVVATPGPSVISASTNIAPNHATGISATNEEDGDAKPGPAVLRVSGDYFFANSTVPMTQIANTKASEASNENQHDQPNFPVEPEKDVKSGSLFGKKFRMNFPKKLGRSSAEKHPVVDEKSEESDKSSEKEDKIVEDNFYGIIQKIRNEYEERLSSNPGEPLTSGINPSLPNETPVLRPPPFTTIIIQEDKMEAGGLADLYRGTVRSVGQDAELIERAAPMWLGDLLLRNQTPVKDVVKVSFILQPYQDLLPGIAGVDGNARLNANRMLRAKKILGYVTERIDPISAAQESDPDTLKPEEYLDLYCHDQLVPPDMTLGTLRAHVWKTGGDVVLYYRSNGRKPDLEAKHAMAKARQEQEAKETPQGRMEESMMKSSGAILSSSTAVVGGGTGFM